MAKAEATLQEMEAKLQQTRAVLEDRQRERRQMQAMEQKLRDTGDINKLVKFQARAFAMDKAIQEVEGELLVLESMRVQNFKKKRYQR